MFKLRGFVTVAYLLLLTSLVHAQPKITWQNLPDITVSEQQIPNTVLKVCGKSTGSSDLRRWQPNLRVALKRFRSRAYGTDKAFSIQFVPMSECADLGKHSCFGKSGVVLCNETVLERLVYASAIMSGFQMRAMLKRLNSPKAGSAKNSDLWVGVLNNLDFTEIGAIEALSLVDAVEADQVIRGVYAPGEITKLEKRKRQLIESFGSRASNLIEEAFTTAWGLQELDLDLRLLKNISHDEALFFEIMHMIYQSTVEETLSFIMGHELTHSHRGCLVASPAPHESEVRFAQFVDIQISKRLFCPNPPSISELNADRCALRVLNATDVKLQRRENFLSIGYKVKPGFLNIGRRHAIDLLGFFMAASIGKSTQISYAPYTPNPVINGRPQYFPELKVQDGYFYSALRLLLIADLLHGRSNPKLPGVGVCGANAERLLELIIRARIGCKEHAQNPAKTLTLELKRLALPMAPGIASFFTSQTYSHDELRCETNMNSQ